MAKDLHSFIREIEECYPEDLAQVKRLVDPNQYEVTALLEHLTMARRFPMVLFHRTMNHLGQESGFPIVSNVFATRERCATALGFSRDQCQMPLALEYARRERCRVEPQLISEAEAPSKEVVFQGDEVDLGRLPIVRHFTMDLGPVMTMSCAMRDPEEGFYDLSFIKGFYKGPRKLGVSIHSPHFDRILDHYEKQNEPAPIIYILGHHPAFSLGVLALSPYGNDDYATIGSFLGEPVRLTPSTTWGERFLVPADAEIVVEAELQPGVREVVDPFGEVTRHYQAQCLRPVAQVTAVTHRRDAIMQDIFSGHHGHWNLGAIPKEGSIYNALQRRFGNIVAVHMPHSGCGRLTCYVSIRKSREGQAKPIALAALNETWMIQWVVVVDEDVDVFNEEEVQWAVATSVNPLRDVDVIQNAYTLFYTASGYNKTIIDATRPLDVAFPAKIEVPKEAMERVKLEEWLA